MLRVFWFSLTDENLALERSHDTLQPAELGCSDTTLKQLSDRVFKLLQLEPKKLLLHAEMTHTHTHGERERDWRDCDCALPLVFPQINLYYCSLSLTQTDDFVFSLNK